MVSDNKLQFVIRDDKKLQLSVRYHN